MSESGLKDRFLKVELPGKGMHILFKMQTKVISVAFNIFIDQLKIKIIPTHIILSLSEKHTSCNLFIKSWLRMLSYKACDKRWLMLAAGIEVFQKRPLAGQIGVYPGREL